MCGRYASMLPPQMMAELFNLLNSIETVPRFNIAPTQPIAAIWETGGRREAHFARWGLVPGWVKDPREFPLLVNARVETMLEKPAFRDAIKHGRCIIPASGYYEWHANPDKTKQPYYIAMADGAPMALAGLYTTWEGPNGEVVDTVATITVPANPQLSAIHDRMPAILRGRAIDDWLNVREVRAGTAAQLALPLEDGALRFHPVSTRVNSARDDDAGLIEPVTVEVPEPRRTKAAAGGQMSLFEGIAVVAFMAFSQQTSSGASPGPEPRVTLHPAQAANGPRIKSVGSDCGAGLSGEGRKCRKAASLRYIMPK